MLSHTIVIAYFMQVLSMSGIFSWWTGCATPQVMSNLDTARYLGTWYEAYRMKNAPYQHGDCDTMQIYQREDGNIRAMASEQHADGHRGGMNATVKRANSHSDSGNLEISAFGWMWLQYDVMYTDYDTH